MIYTIESHCFLTQETYIEKYDSEKSRAQGLEKMFVREDIQVSDSEFQTVLESKFYTDGYDSIFLKEVKI